MTLGTFDYISPEQARDPRAADVRSDLYSLGCTLFFMLAGRAPFAEGTMVQKLLQHQQDPPPPIEALRPDVPDRLAAILARLMAKDPNDRYQRPAVLAADLAACAAEHGITLAATAAAGPAVVAVPRPSSPLPWLVPIVALLVTVAALWLKAASDRAPPPPAAAPAPTAQPGDPRDAAG
jgi:serine/threonine-protein kinase